MRGSDVAELRAFMAIVECGNFARAAERLAVTPSALSQSIRRLERRLGQRLLNRTTRTTRPTDAGQTLYERLRPAFAEIDTAQEDLITSSGTVAGRLRINASEAGAAHALAPRMNAFLQNHPRIEVEIVISGSLDDLVASGCDAGVRLGNVLEADMIRLPLTGPVRWIAVASPAYLERAGTPVHPDDLTGHACLNMRWPGNGHLYQWEFEKGDERVRVPVRGPLCTNDAATRLRTATDGLGIAYMLETEAAEALRSGAVVEVLPDWCQPETGFCLYYPGNRLVTPPLRAFCDLIKSTRTMAAV
ncbi:LysR family transcriptional regulator [uncultured Nitratireductor sp.]|uniref:LysR family transcriptional regulator n=1 Tax=uncultured Nitratireductor sp. TaxID=520953 RepID=UPI0025D6E94A|nr:LysR family transcriptional regulator [uncultured Nitratireductor sp.]